MPDNRGQERYAGKVLTYSPARAELRAYLKVGSDLFLYFADDDNVLACALAAKSAYLVTGDADLLTLKNFRGVKIITPRDFEALFD